MAPSSLFLKVATLVVAGLSSGVLAELPYVVEDVYKGNGSDRTGFFDLFNFFTADDPNGGYVDYKDEADAFGSFQLASVNGYGQAFLGVDHAQCFNGTNARGRPALRIQSKKLYNGGLFVADIAHMPGSICGVWPAFWTGGLPPDYPAHGEIDIIENINENTFNLETLHTNAGCNITNSLQKGTPQDDGVCDNNFQDGTNQYLNQGCSVKDDQSITQPSYGTPFNDLGGGVYVMEWTSTTIKIWNFPRGNIPWDIAGETPDPSLWTDPTLIAGDQCDVSQHFQNHNMIFDTSFCGSYAGQPALWAKTSCYSAGWADCESYVAANPNAFEQAYWLVNYVKVYQRQAVTTTTTSSTITSSATSTATSATTTTSATGTPIPTHVASVGPYNWIGCETEASFSRTLNSSTFSNYTTMTVELCEAFCSSPIQYLYFGVEYSGECYCGDVLEPGSAPAPYQECNMVCDGSPYEYCGGSDRLDLYQLNGVSKTQSSTATSSSTTTPSSTTTTSSSSTTTSSSLTTTSISSSSLSSSSSSSSSSSFPSSSITSTTSSTSTTSTTGSSSSTSPTISSSSSSSSSRSSTTSPASSSSSTTSSSSSSTTSSSSSSTTSPSSSSTTSSSISSPTSSSTTSSSTTQSTPSSTSSSTSSSSTSQSTPSSTSTTTTSGSSSTSSTTVTSSSSSSSSNMSITSTTSSSTTASQTSTASPTTSLDCQHDNCLRAFLRHSTVTEFCHTYTTTVNTATTGFPTGIGNCKGDYSAISSACSCVVAPPTSSPPTSSPPTSSPPTSSPPTSSPPSSTTSTSSPSSSTSPSNSTTSTSSMATSTMAPYGNSSTSSMQMTTSTVYTTATYTITKCPETVTNCPARSTTVVTSTIALYTTVCPVSAVKTPSSTVAPTSNVAPESTTSTVYTTAYITITQCPATVTNCPAHSTKVYTSTYALYTTVCPVSNHPPSPHMSIPAISSPAMTGIASASSPAVTVVTVPVIPVSSMLYAAGNNTKPASLPFSIAAQSSPSGPTAKPSTYKTSGAQTGNAVSSMVTLLMVAAVGMSML